jgi:hypothetical protein
MYWDSFNMHGAFAYLWEVPQISAGVFGSTWNAYDAFTGEWVYTMTNVPGGTNVYGPNGEILRYVVNTANGWMALWNSTKAVSFEGWTIPEIVAETGMPIGQAEFAHGSWVPYGRTIDASQHGWDWNVTIPAGLAGGATAFLEDRIIGSNIPFFFGFAPDPISIWAISTAQGDEGRLLFNTAWSTPSGNLTMFYGAGSVDEGVFTLRSKETRQWWGFSLSTGMQLWGPTEPQVQLDIYDVYGVIAYGKLFSTGMGGVVYAYDVTSGALLWTYEASDLYSEILWSNNWPMRVLFVTDGKIYVGHEEHSPIDPKPRGAPFICLDAETGEEIWRADGLFRQNHWGTNAVIGDSVIATMDTYDQRVYAIGKGPSETTIDVSPKISSHGSNVLVEGKVTDVSPGTKDAALQMRFPKGVPAVADENMSEWMLYVYKQFPRPADVVGVEVVISVLDPNNNYYEVSRTTADEDGFFSVEFEPEVPGKYTIIAEFEGSKAYYGSYTKTAISVVEAPATSEPTPPPASAADVYLLPGIVGIIITIVVVGAVIVLMQRKK